MGVGGEKGEFGVGGGTVLNFFKKSAKKESNDPLVVGTFLACPLAAFSFSAHIILVVCMLGILCCFYFQVDQFYSLEHNENAYTI